LRGLLLRGGGEEMVRGGETVIKGRGREWERERGRGRKEGWRRWKDNGDGG